MPNISYIDGEYCNYEKSKVHINDRGYHFGDSVYEVIIFDKNTYYDFDAHIKRLFNSLKSLQINFNKSPLSIKLIIKNLIRINRAEYGSIYLQVSRGIVERSHSYHDLNMRPILSITITKKT